MDNEGFHIKGGILINDNLHFTITLIKNLFVRQIDGFKIAFYLFKGFVWGVTFFGFETVGK